MTTTLVQLSPKPGPRGPFVPFRFRPIGDAVLLTNPIGEWAFVTPDELRALHAGEVAPGSDLFEKLRAAHFVRDEAETARLAKRAHEQKSFLDHGPNLHVLVVTLRCNQSCAYCHASRADMAATETDMSLETAEKVVDRALQSTSPSITLEFQGGEPLVVFPTIRHVVEYAKKKNRAYGKTIEFTLVSNLTLMDEEKLRFLLENRVQICTSIDGPPPLHDKQRRLTGSSEGTFHTAARWIARINEAYVAMGLDPVLYHVEALLTTTREALAQPKAIVDTYVDLGCRALFLRPLDPFGFAARSGKTLGYSVSDFLAYYRAAVDYVVELNRSGVQVLERFAAIFLRKILTGEDPNYLDLRNPCGAGIGQIAYAHDGRVYTCDEGRMMASMGDPFFAIGTVDDPYRKLVTHPTVRALLVASNLDAQPDCVSCAFAPYCGVCPVHNYRTQGSLFGRMRESTWCAVHKGIQDYLFEKLLQNDPHVIETFRRWTTVRSRTHFLQTCEAT